MDTLLTLVAVIGLAPLLLGMARLGRAAPGTSPWPAMVSILLCALAFNLTFFWQELWLVVPKALTPGLVPVLYHNDHGWTGDAPTVELLQGTGALATLASGVIALALAPRFRRLPRWHLFLFWMGFQGLFQSFSQFAIGTILSGNDVGRALAYLGLGGASKALLLLLVVMAMGAAGILLAAQAPAGLARGAAYRTRSFGVAISITALACVLLAIPFRVPREPVEVILIPAIVNLIGAGWLVLGVALQRREPRERGDVSFGFIAPTIALFAVLLFFQVVLRPGITL